MPLLHEVGPQRSAKVKRTSLPHATAVDGLDADGGGRRANGDVRALLEQLVLRWKRLRPKLLKRGRISR